MTAKTHGMSKVNGRATRTYRAWVDMKRRCSDPSQDRYWGRGIRVCERWASSFENFLADMGECPDGCDLDRFDNDGHYEPGNARWLDHKRNSRNRSDNRLLTHLGETRTLAEWADVTGLGSALQGRLRMGWSVADALTKPKGARSFWTDAEIEILRVDYPVSPARCASMLPGRTLHAIHGAAHKLGIRYRSAA